MRLPLLALLTVAPPLVAQAPDVVPNDTMAIAVVAVERFLAGRDQQPTELSPQLVCLRLAGEGKWCTPSAEGRRLPVLERLATELALPVGTATPAPSCAPPAATGRVGLQLRLASLRIAGDTAQVGVSLWCMSAGRPIGNGCRYELVRQRDQWAVRPGVPVTCFRG